MRLAILFLEKEKYTTALAVFDKQSTINELAENCYYKALAYKGTEQLDQKKTYLQKAKALYLSETYMFDVFTHQIDKIYLKDIEKETF